MTATDPRSRLQMRQSMAAHLAELRQLLGQEVSERDLLTLDETSALRSAAPEGRQVPTSRVEIAFQDRLGEKFKEFISRLEATSGGRVYLWTPTSQVCGVHRPVPLSDLNLGFDYSINEDGVLSIVTEDLSDRLLLDFFEDDAGTMRLEITTAGPRWGRIPYE